MQLLTMKPSFLNLVLFKPFTFIARDKATKSVSICQGLFGIAVFAIAPLGEIPENVNNSLDKVFFVKNYYFVTYADNHYFGYRCKISLTSFRKGEMCLLHSEDQLKYRRNG